MSVNTEQVLLIFENDPSLASGCNWQEQATSPTPRRIMSVTTNIDTIESGSFTILTASSWAPDEEDGNVKLTQPESPRLYEQENNIGDLSFNGEGGIETLPRDESQNTAVEADRDQAFVYVQRNRRSRIITLEICCFTLIIGFILFIGVIVFLVLSDSTKSTSSRSSTDTRTHPPLPPLVEYSAFADTSIREGGGSYQILGSETSLEVSRNQEIISRALMAFDLTGLPLDNIFQEKEQERSDYTVVLKLWVAETTNEGPLRVLRVQGDTTAGTRARSLENSNYETATGASFSYSIIQIGDSFVVDSSLFDLDGSIVVDISQLVRSRASEEELLLLIEMGGEFNNTGRVALRSREFEDGSQGPMVIVRFPTPVPTILPSVSLAPSTSPSISLRPTFLPSHIPTRTANPSNGPSGFPSLSNRPSRPPTDIPTISMSPSRYPTSLPSSSDQPSATPSLSREPSILPQSSVPTGGFSRPASTTTPVTSLPSDEPSLLSVPPLSNHPTQKTTPPAILFPSISPSSSISPTDGQSGLVMQGGSAMPSSTPFKTEYPSSPRTLTPTGVLSDLIETPSPSNLSREGETNAPVQTENPDESSTLTQFCVIADVPYTAEEEQALPNQIANQTDGCEFLIHLGDIMRGADRCAEERYVAVRNILTTYSNIPVFMLPGDNEWNDCGNQAQIDAGWDKWSTNFLRFEENWESHTLFDVQRQATHEENFSFVYRRTLFLGFNIVGGRIHDEEEWKERLRDEYNWLVQAVRRNIPNNADGIIIMAHAAPKEDDHRWFFDPLEDYVRDELNNTVPILYIHGDGHAWKYRPNWKDQSSMLKIQLEGGTREPVLKILADPHAKGSNPVDAFQFNRQLHLSNIFADE
jgi:hypothetical protein